jgi:uncharacterized protein (TIGR02217 family)
MNSHEDEIIEDLFLDITFPEGLQGFEITSMEFFTVVQRGKNGAESRLILNKRGRIKYILETAILHPNKIEEVVNFFKIAKGRGHSFRFKDVNDFKVCGEGLIGNEDGVLSLCKTYAYETFEFKRIITKPRRNTIKLFDNNKLLKENEDYMIDYSTGTVTFMPKTPANPFVKAYFEFDIEARFEADELIIKRDSWGNLFLPSLIITEIVS